MKYNARDAYSVIPEGEYQATIKAYSERDGEGRALTNKAGTEQACLVTFEVYTDAGNRTVSQKFTERTTLFLYRQLAQALGKSDEFKAGTWTAEDHIGDALTLVVKVKSSDQYGDQNQFSYKPPLGTAAPRKAAAPAAAATGRVTPTKPIDDGDIPF